ncbi:LuxR C-terminal-related transcriptional regulator [Massilia sp. TSP1-1-2]|uniref:LuxR C-terminal-related transcriptional regulator n=1 Tax=unclassified Massilia TaxID=2609279 RepID=UPI003CF70C01
MTAPVILSKREQEYLLRIIESSLQVDDLRQFFLWSQGQLQALLPHQLMVCMQFSGAGVLQRIEALHASVEGESAIARLCDPHAGLAVRLARHCSAPGVLPCMAQLHGHGPLDRAVAPFQAELADCGYANVIIDGSGPVAGGATVFALFGLPMRPGARHAYFLALLLPQLHLALVRLARPGSALARTTPGAAGRALSAREAQIVHWLRAGKRNDEIGAILGLSGLTVKNHLQRIYKLLGVRNRVEAVTRCTDAGLLANERLVISAGT